MARAKGAGGRGLSGRFIVTRVKHDIDDGIQLTHVELVADLLEGNDGWDRLGTGRGRIRLTISAEDKRDLFEEGQVFALHLNPPAQEI